MKTDMKRKTFALFLVCAISAMLFTGCDYEGEEWVSQIGSYFVGLMANDSGMKNIDRAHKKAFDSVFNDIEIFGAKLCVPMKVSELPDKFELSNAYSTEGYIPLSENEPQGAELNGGLKRYRLDLYYDKEIRVAKVYIICNEDQSVEEGIICEIELGVLYTQPVWLGGQVEIHSGIDEVKEFLGEGNEFNDIVFFSTSAFYTVFYTDGDRILELTYGIQGDDLTFLLGYIRTYNNYEVI